MHVSYFSSYFLSYFSVRIRPLNRDGASGNDGDIVATREGVFTPAEWSTGGGQVKCRLEAKQAHD